MISTESSRFLSSFRFGCTLQVLWCSGNTSITDGCLPGARGSGSASYTGYKLACKCVPGPTAPAQKNDPRKLVKEHQLLLFKVWVRDLNFDPTVQSRVVFWVLRKPSSKSSNFTNKTNTWLNSTGCAFWSYGNQGSVFFFIRLAHHTWDNNTSYLRYSVIIMTQ